MNNGKSMAMGWSQTTKSFDAGQGAAKMAMENMGSNGSANWAMAFTGGRHKPDAVLEGLRSVLGEVDIIGGSVVGLITNQLAEYSGYECGVVLFPSTLSKPVTVAVNHLDQGEVETGKTLGAKLREIANEGDEVILFYDSVRSGPPPVLNTASRLVEGIYLGLGDKPLKLLGAGLVGDFQLNQSYIFNGSGASKQAVVAVVLPREISVHTTIMHGCIPISSFMKITKIDGPVIYEIDGRPALDVLKEICGGTGEELAEQNLSLIVTLGEKHGDPMAPYDESSYVNRLIVSADKEEGSVTLFEADFTEGTNIQIMTRDNQLMLDSVKKRTKELFDSMNSAELIGGLYINCAGRCSAFTGSEVEDAKILQEEWKKDIPLMGFYSGVELAPLLGRTRPLDWTGVLSLFTLDRE